MAAQSSCGGCGGGESTRSAEKGSELVSIAKTDKVCPMCEDFSKRKLEEKAPIAILCCEGGCLRGEVARRAANLICFSLMPDKTARVCLGGAFTKDTGQRELVRKTRRVVALEGCFIECASRMMKGVVPTLNPEVVIVDRLYEFDKKLFGINDMPDRQIDELARIAADEIVGKMNQK